MVDTGIQDRLQHLEDTMSIIQTLYQFGHAVDYGPETQFLDLFTEEGKWKRQNSNLPDRSFEGKEGLTEMFRNNVPSRAPKHSCKHIVCNPIVKIAGDTANASSYLIFASDGDDGPYIRAFSRCMDTLVRCQDGRWRIVERTAELEAAKDSASMGWSHLPKV